MRGLWTRFVLESGRSGLCCELRACFAVDSIVASGVFYIIAYGNLITASLTFVTSWVYIFRVHAGEKNRAILYHNRRAVPGAMPIVPGWCAEGGRLDARASILFALLYFRQFPHFHSIAILYRADYRQASIRMLAAVDGADPRLSTEITLGSVLTVAASALLYLLHLSGRLYLVVAIVLGFGFVSPGTASA